MHLNSLGINVSGSINGQPSLNLSRNASKAWGKEIHILISVA